MGTMGGALLLYVVAALAEIAGCFSFWAWARLGKSALWLAPGMLSLAVFAWVLTRIDAQFAGRAERLEPTLSWCTQPPALVIGQDVLRCCIGVGAIAYQPPSEAY